jgi:hypothetical protein
MLREVMGFATEESAQIPGGADPVFRYRLGAAPQAMVEAFEGPACSSTRPASVASNQGLAN